MANIRALLTTTGSNNETFAIHDRTRFRVENYFRVTELFLRGQTTTLRRVAAGGEL